MRVLYRVCKGKESVAGEDLLYEQVGPVEFCCWSMQAWWGKLVGFGARGYPRSTDGNVNLFALVPQANGKTVLGLARISFCPFCGEIIEVRRKRDR